VLLCRIFRLLLLPGGEVIGVVGFASDRELAILLSVALVDGLVVGVDVELIRGIPKGRSAWWRRRN